MKRFLTSIASQNRLVAPAIWLLALILISTAAHAQESLKLVASDESAEAFFGFSVSIDGQRALVGAFGDGSRANVGGAAYVFERREDGQWEEVAILTPDGLQPQFIFGNSVALDGDRALVGAISDEDAQSGAAYVFERDSNGLWEEVAKLIASNDGSINRFGEWVALDGNRALIGTTASAFYVFERGGDGQWEEVALLTPSAATSPSNFGNVIALDGDRVLIESTGDGADQAGAAYVVERGNDGQWQDVTRLSPAESDSLDMFGAGVSLSGDQLLVGAPGDDDGAEDAGAVYVFERINGQWQETAKLTASDGQQGDLMGTYVSMSGDRMLASAHFEDENGENAGAVYVFDLVNGQWEETTKLIASDGQTLDNFGRAVSLSRGWALIGAPFNDADGAPIDDETGAAYLFNLNRAPDPSQITSPEDGATVLLAGDPAAPFMAEWTAATDPDGDLVNYVWQLASHPDFAAENILFFGETETALLFATDIGTVATLLTNAGITGFPVTLHHRVLTLDGQVTTEGPPAQVTFERGAITATEGASNVPDDYVLDQNYPNPFNPETQIRFALPVSSQVRLAVYDVLGREVAVLIDAHVPAGRHEAVFEAGALPSGLYVYQLQAAGQTLTQKMLLLK